MYVFVVSITGNQFQCVEEGRGEINLSINKFSRKKLGFTQREILGTPLIEAFARHEAVHDESMHTRAIPNSKV